MTKDGSENETNTIPSSLQFTTCTEGYNSKKSDFGPHKVYSFLTISCILPCTTLTNSSFQCTQNCPLWSKTWVFTLSRKSQTTCLSVRTEKLCFHRTDFYKTWYTVSFRKSVENIKVPLKYDKNNGYFAWRRFHIYDITVLNSS